MSVAETWLVIWIFDIPSIFGIAARFCCSTAFGNVLCDTRLANRGSETTIHLESPTSTLTNHGIPMMIVDGLYASCNRTTI